MSPVTHRGRRRLDRDRPVERLRGLLDDDLAATAPTPTGSRQDPELGRLCDLGPLPDTARAPVRVLGADPVLDPLPDSVPGGAPGAPERIEPPEEQTAQHPVRLRLPWVSLLIAGLVLGLVVLSLLTRGPGEQEVVGAAATGSGASVGASGGSAPDSTAPDGSVSGGLVSGGAAGSPLPATAAATTDPAPGAGPGPTPPPGAAPATGPLTVHVVGEVQRPGVVEVPAGSRIGDAVEAAGGLRDTAVVDAVNLAAPAADGMQIVIPDRARAEAGQPAGQPAPAPGSPSSPGPAVSSPGQPGAGAGTGAAEPAGAGPSGGAAGTGLLDLNTATAAQLEELPEVGPVLAQRIIDHREQIGGFRAVEELDDVSGIGPAMMEALVPLVAV